VRELRNVITRAVALAGPDDDFQSLPFVLRPTVAAPGEISFKADKPFHDAKDALVGLKCAGIVPDRLLSSEEFIGDTGVPEAFQPTAVGKTFLRWNRPDCAFIAGPTNAFTAKDHLFAPGAEVEKSLVVLNDRRRSQTVAWTWQLWRKDDKLVEKRGRVDVAPGGRAWVPVAFAFPRRAKDGEDYRLTATFNFVDGTTQRDECVLQAVKALRKAMANGFNDVPSVRAEPNFAAIRDRADFRACSNFGPLYRNH